MGITVTDVTKRFRNFVALDDVSVEVPDGSLTTLLGPSGSGKSTLLRVIAGLEAPDTGSVRISDREATRLPPQKRNVGFVFQHYAAFKHMTVAENVAFGLKIRKRLKREIQERVDELLRLVQLEGFAERYPSQLSGGQRQRMALARALAIEPQVLLLDEPFGALDARVRKDLRDWLRRLHDEVHVTTVLVTHDQEEAMEVSDRIVLMNHGRVEQVGTPTEIYDHPASEFAMGFIGEVNRLGDRFIRPHDIGIRRSGQEPAVKGCIERVVHVGFEVRAQLALEDGHRVWAQIGRNEADTLELRPGQEVSVDVSRTRAFDGPLNGSHAHPRIGAGTGVAS
jgi:sulfate transport system ATP-binding protein